MKPTNLAPPRSTACNGWRLTRHQLNCVVALAALPTPNRRERRRIFMRYYKCKCGERTAWSSMGVYSCERCSKCGSNLAEGPTSHRDPSPHQMLAVRVSAATDSGVRDVGTLTQCVWCQQTLAEIETAKDPWEHWPNPQQVFFLDGKRHHVPDEVPYAIGASVRAKLQPGQHGHALHFDDPAKPLGAAIEDGQAIAWGSRIVSVPHAYR